MPPVMHLRKEVRTFGVQYIGNSSGAAAAAAAAASADVVTRSSGSSNGGISRGSFRGAAVAATSAGIVRLGGSCS